MELFYSKDIDKEFITLSEEESRHIIKVFRKKRGESVFVTDGNGRLFRTHIYDQSSAKCLLKIEEEVQQTNTNQELLHIAIAPTKNHDRLEWFVEKATEIGIFEITPIICSNSERKKVQAERLNRLLIAAMKQSQRLHLPKLNQETPFKAFIQQSFPGQRFIAYCHGKDNELLKNTYLKGKKAVVMIGPEGDFTQEEIQSAKENGFTPVSLGNTRFRTETASLVACHTIALLNE